MLVNMMQGLSAMVFIVFDMHAVEITELLFLWLIL